jgi:gluconate:H+ symporter, GntP family
MITLIALFIIILFIIMGTVKYKLHPFLLLLLASLAIGFTSGLNTSTIIQSIEKGFGDTLKSIGIIIAFGATIGVYLQKSGAAKIIAETVLRFVGVTKSPLAMNISGFIISIPVFCDSGFIILSPLNKAISKQTGISLAILTVALSTGLYATHVFVPPTPGPLAAAATLQADIGLVLILGLLVAIPSALTGLLWAKYAGQKHPITIKETQDEDVTASPSKVLSFTPILAPIVLIALKAIADYPTHPLGEGILRSYLSFLGNPVIALLIGVLLAFFLKNTTVRSHADWIGDGLASAGVIILITGAGGAFGNVLRATNLGIYLGEALSSWHVGIILPFVIAAILKTAQGSSTVAIITTAAIVSPLLSSLGMDSETGKALAVLAIGAGAMTVSHINDSYFWIVSQFSGMDMTMALKTHSVATLLQGFSGIAFIFILSLLFL